MIIYFLASQTGDDLEIVGLVPTIKTTCTGEKCVFLFANLYENPLYEGPA